VSNCGSLMVHCIHSLDAFGEVEIQLFEAALKIRFMNAFSDENR
jgi:hypothetical protein